LTLHKVMTDGTTVHVEFSKASWEDALRDPAVARRWGHAPDDCGPDPWGRRFTPVEKAEVAPPAEEPVVEERITWPPDSGRLTPWMLRQLTTLGEFDSVEVLAGPRKALSEQAKRPMTNGRGQFVLF
jgi:hypothetical protein